MESWFKDKSVALVGNALSLFDSCYGEEIDRHDVVVRLNRAAMLYTRYDCMVSHGMKTNVWMFWWAQEYLDKLAIIDSRIKKMHMSLNGRGHHTTEILLRCDNANPTNYDGTEAHSALLVYRGFHCLFYGNTTSVNYNLWAINNGSYSSQNTPYGEPLQQNTWVHYAATRDGDIITLYKNGKIITSNNVTTTSVVPNVSNDLIIGRAAVHTAGYSWASDIKVSLARMYTTALDPDQILQNYIATKGRYGL